MYKLTHPRSGWAEQDPAEWWTALVSSVPRDDGAVRVGADAIAGLSVDATTCTVVALDSSDRVLRPAIMWMDVLRRTRPPVSVSRPTPHASTTAVARRRCPRSGCPPSCSGSRSRYAINPARPRAADHPHDPADPGQGVVGLVVCVGPRAGAARRRRARGDRLRRHLRPPRCGRWR